LETCLGKLLYLSLILATYYLCISRSRSLSVALSFYLSPALAWQSTQIAQTPQVFAEDVTHTSGSEALKSALVKFVA